MARLVTRVTSKNFCIVNPSFELVQVTDLEGKTMLRVSEGQACINGMDIIAKQNIRIYPPDEEGDYFLALHLWRDSSSNVLGDLTIGITKQFKGVYLDWWTEKDENDTDALWLGKVHYDGENFTSIEEDLDKYGRIWAHDILCKVEDWKHPTLSRILLQDWMYKVPDWYLSKEGDVMFGPIEFLAGRDPDVDGTLDNHEDLGTGKYGLRIEVPDKDNVNVIIKAPNVLDTDTNNTLKINESADGTDIKIGPATIITKESNNYNFTLNTPNRLEMNGQAGVTISSGINKSDCKLTLDDNVAELSDATCIKGTVKYIFAQNSITEKFGNGVENITDGSNLDTNVVGDITITSNEGDGNVTVNASEFHVEGDITAQRVWNAVYNDLAEYMEKADYNEVINSGDIVVFTSDGKVTKPSGKVTDSDRIAGVVSSNDTMGFILGGDNIPPEGRVPVALAGRVNINTGDMNVQAGDLIALDRNGNLKIVGDYSRYVLGKATKNSINGKTYILVK